MLSHSTNTGSRAVEITPYDMPRARVAYQDFLTLGKDADPGVPVMKQALTEYNNLK